MVKLLPLYLTFSDCQGWPLSSFQQTDQYNLEILQCELGKNTI